MNWAVNTEDRSYLQIKLRTVPTCLLDACRGEWSHSCPSTNCQIPPHWGLALLYQQEYELHYTPSPVNMKGNKKITFFASELQLRTKIHLQLLWAALTQNLVTFLQTCMSGYSTDFRKLCDYAGYVCCRQFFTFVCNVYGKWLLWISMLVQKMPKIYNIYLQIQLKSWEQMICFCNRLQ